MSTIGLYQDAEEIAHLKRVNCVTTEHLKRQNELLTGLLQEAKEIIELKNVTIAALEEHVKLLQAQVDQLHSSTR